MDGLGDRVRHRSIDTNGVRLFAAEAGPEDGSPVILLHGFPEYWYGWRNQIGALADAGYRVIVPDQRGYYISEKPRKIRDYKLDTLVADIVGLIDDADADHAAIVGHDWGGVVAWRLAQTRPDRVRRLAVLNAPHPDVMRQAIWSDGAQRRRSRYMFLFQLPALPERRLSRNLYQPLRHALQESARPGTFTEDELDRYLEAWAAPGALTGMLNWYRAMRYRLPSTSAPQIEPPTLLVWGMQDSFLGESLLEPSLSRCRDGRVVRLHDATHWVQHEEPEQVNAALLEFLGATS
ncbi:MAG: alpha/beta fold hydrolase [Acidobacteria bacterium]|nr:alpha/beta fold hydrolase [Acidobacteriota bacterium]